MRLVANGGVKVRPIVAARESTPSLDEGAVQVAARAIFERRWHKGPITESLDWKTALVQARAALTALDAHSKAQKD